MRGGPPAAASPPSSSPCARCSCCTSAGSPERRSSRCRSSAAAIAAEAAGRRVEVGLVPLASIRDVLLHGTRFAQVWILGGNVLTLAPFGFLLPFVAPSLATWRRMALAAFLFPLGIELAQLGVSLALGYSYRVTEVDDVLLNFVGVMLGFAAYALLRGAVSTPDPAATPGRVSQPAGEASRSQLRRRLQASHSSALVLLDGRCRGRSSPGAPAS